MALSMRAMADALGVSKSQVQRDKEAGMPMSDVAAAQAWRATHHDVSRTREGRIDRSAAAAPVPGPAPAPMEPPSDGDKPEDEPRPNDTEAYRAARTEREQIRRDRERIELEKDVGNLVDRAEVARLRVTEFRALRDALGNLGPRLAPLVAHESDPLRCEQIYIDALDEVLNAFADQVLTRDVMQDVDDDDDEEEDDQAD
jgi:hypothetical protein